MLLLQVASLVVGISLLAPVESTPVRESENFIFGFESPFKYSFSESVGTGTLRVRLSPESGPLTRDLVFTFRTEDDTATAPGDYASATTQYTFTPNGATRLDIPVTIVDDSIFDGEEQFLCRLSTSDPSATIDEPMTSVVIEENGLLPVGFDPAIYTCSESDGFVDLTVRKLINPLTVTLIHQNVTVLFSTYDGSAQGAQAGLSRDYTAPSTLEDSRVTLSPGRYTKTVRVLINDDTALERPEHFLGNLVISPESAGIAKVTVPQAIVSIIDNDNV